MNTSQKYPVSLPKKEEELVGNYLKRIEIFIDQHHIDHELYSDIEEMVFEKLKNEEKINQINITRILKEVGEPEVIFSDYITEKESGVASEKEGKKQDIPLYDRLKKQEWIRSNDDAYILGISHTLSKKSGLSVGVIRLFLLLLIFFGGISIWIYIIAGLILPIQGKQYTGLSSWGYMRVQVLSLIADIFSNSIASLYQVSKYLLQKIFQIGGVVKKYIFPCVRIIFFGILSIFIFILLLGLLTLAAIYFSGFSIENIDIASLFSTYSVGGVLTGIIATSLLLFSTIVFGVGGKKISSLTLIVTGISILLTLFFGITSILDLVKTYSAQGNFTQEIQGNLDVLDSEVSQYHINLDFLNTQSFLHHLLSRPGVRIQTSNSDGISMQIHYTVAGEKHVSDKIFTGLSPLEINISGKEIRFSYKNGILFQEKVPFSYIKREIVLFIPENIAFSLSPYHSYYFENVHHSEEYETYRNYLPFSCERSLISYSPEEDRFVCYPSEEELEDAKKLFLQNYIIQNFESISPLLHKEEYKRNYYSGYNQVSDWKFTNFSFLDEETLRIRFGDMSLDIDAVMRVEESTEGFLISNFVIEHVDVGPTFHEKYYLNIESIKTFLDKDTQNDE
ncbi:PspC domain-containing protein [Candidatus Gracilibacteria bacterium]|nr:PspC domain-containing protein [Candidatus Gracilibacteria bacterium]